MERAAGEQETALGPVSWREAGRGSGQEQGKARGTKEGKSQGAGPCMRWG